MGSQNWEQRMPAQAKKGTKSSYHIAHSLTSSAQWHQSAGKATRRSERILAINESESQTNTEQQPQYSMKQEACLRYLSPLSTI